MKVSPYLKVEPAVVATQWDGTVENASEIIGWVLNNGGTARLHCVVPCGPGHTKPHTIRIDGPDGYTDVHPREWVLQNFLGRFMGCRDDSFTKLYVEAPHRHAVNIHCGTDIHEGYYEEDANG